MKHQLELSTEEVCFILAALTIIADQQDEDAKKCDELTKAGLPEAAEIARFWRGQRAEIMRIKRKLSRCLP